MKQRKTYLDFIKVIACILVVSLHVMIFNITATKGQTFTLPYYLYYMGVYAIPLFFMCSGYLTLNRSLNWKYIFNKIYNLVILIVLWSVIMYVSYEIYGTNTSVLRILKSVVNQKGPLFHFWYLTLLIILYLISIPVQKQMQKGNGYKILFGLIVIGACFMVGSYILKRPLQRKVYQSLRLWTGLFYFLLGGMMPKILSSKYMEVFQNKKAKILMIVYLLVLPFFVYFISRNGTHHVSMEYQYDTLYIKIASLFIFMLAYNYKFKFPKIWQNLSQLTFGIYVLHAPFLYFFVEKHMKSVQNHIYIYIYIYINTY